MTARRASRQPHRVRRDPREVVVAVVVAVLIVAVTGIAVWILAPGDDEQPPFTPNVPASATGTVPASSPSTTVAAHSDSPPPSLDPSGG